MGTAFSPTDWVPGQTPYSASEMNKLGQGIAGAMPVGAIISSFVLQPGFVALDGSLLSRTTYDALFAWANDNDLIGSGKPFGPGDGSTTFQAPDFTDRMLLGASTARPVGTQGGAETHTHVNPDTSAAGGHAHTQASTGSGGGHQHSNPSTGAAGGHDHGSTTGGSGGHDHGSATGDAGGHAHSNPNTSTVGSHSHGSAGSHSHGIPDNTSLQAVELGTANAANDGHDHGGSTTSGGSHSHGSAGGHDHTVGNTGSVADHAHSITSVPNHTHTITSIADHSHSQGATGSAGHHSHGNPNTDSVANHQHTMADTLGADHLPPWAAVIWQIRF